MSDDKKFQDLQREIEILRDQKGNILSEYSAKYAELDKKVKELSSQKDSLEKDIVRLTSNKDEISHLIDKIGKDASLMQKSAEDKAQEIINIANKTAQEIIERAEDINKKATKIEADNRSKIDNANQMERKAQSLLNEATTISNDAVDKKDKLEKAISKAKADALKVQEEVKKYSELISLVNQQKEALDIEAKVIISQKAELNKEIALFNDAKSALVNQQESFDASMSERTAEFNKKLAEYDVLHAQLIRQKEENSFKSAELDAGFAKLKREQEAVRKQQLVIDNIKKEMSSK